MFFAHFNEQFLCAINNIDWFWKKNKQFFVLWVNALNWTKLCQFFSYKHVWKLRYPTVELNNVQYSILILSLRKRKHRSCNKNSSQTKFGALSQLLHGQTINVSATPRITCTKTQTKGGLWPTAWGVTLPINSWGPLFSKSVKIFRNLGKD